MSNVTSLEAVRERQVERLQARLAVLAGTIEYMRAACVVAQGDCMKVGSIQWTALQKAIDRAVQDLPACGP